MPLLTAHFQDIRGASDIPNVIRPGCLGRNILGVGAILQQVPQGAGLGIFVSAGGSPAWAPLLSTAFPLR